MGTKSSSVVPRHPHASVQGKHISLFNRVFVLRQLLTLCLFCVGGVLSLTTYFTMRKQENDLANSHYNSVARSAVGMVQAPVARNLDGSAYQAMKLKASFPEISAWPNVQLPIDDATAVFKKITGYSSMFFAPIVRPDQLSSFETFAFNYWDLDSTIPPSAGYFSPGQRGVWTYDASTGNSYHDTTGDSWPPEEIVIAPILQVSPSSSPLDTRSTSSVGYSLLG
ncbi:hypothetical protein B484DRAFT_433747 [Ochromonadaceae sp. CCMP2298]|nr:hypothetical protein B484DRAFT_433747 [Ochromonadaceae sp. CCMP2298]